MMGGGRLSTSRLLFRFNFSIKVKVEKERIVRMMVTLFLQVMEPKNR